MCALQIFIIIIIINYTFLIASAKEEKGTRDVKVKPDVGETEGEEAGAVGGVGVVRIFAKQQLKAEKKSSKEKVCSQISLIIQRQAIPLVSLSTIVGL